MKRHAEAGWFHVCRAFGRVLGSARYTRVRIIVRNGRHHVLKRRRFHAPLLIRLSEPLLRLLNTGVRVLRQAEWQQREHMLYREIHDQPIRIAGDGTLVLPCLPGVTLAALLTTEQLDDRDRMQAIERAVVALADLHGRGFTHGDAMAGNVMIDGASGFAHWFDFETVHEPRRPLAWRRADDVRALLATCVLRTRPDQLASTVNHVLDVYADEEVGRVLADCFAPVLQRPLLFHLGQADLSLQTYREIGRLLAAHAR